MKPGRKGEVGRGNEMQGEEAREEVPAMRGAKGDGGGARVRKFSFAKMSGQSTAMFKKGGDGALS